MMLSTTSPANLHPKFLPRSENDRGAVARRRTKRRVNRRDRRAARRIIRLFLVGQSDVYTLYLFV